ncbi:Phosphoinositide 3-kinase regulatory subunit 6 [Bagarius yarrelli]|uniref:Phosphoinositide 3-kinase regulatory subunit 6 n=1 Tax=Bagarius yarrelli TaxID=175774 RepID=A0A556VWV2_BAGYA|nr:Phosphoinositide 3-kinase regulatory subunit 6 [Bagarius yarrelli]
MEDFDMCDFSSSMDPDMPRHSVISTDSGIERDMVQDSESRGSWRLLRRGGIKVKPSVTDSMTFLQDALVGGSGFLKQQQHHRHMTANILVMGDDRVLGRLARAYYTLRKRESRRLFLTTKVNIKMFYIPVSMQQLTSSTTVCLSNREEERSVSVRTSRIHITALTPNREQDVNCLLLDVCEVKTSCVLEASIRTSSVKLQTTEETGFTLCLDKDSRRTFHKVQRSEVTGGFTDQWLSVIIKQKNSDFIILVSAGVWSVRRCGHFTLVPLDSVKIEPCKDPGYYIQKSMRSKFTTEEERDSGLSRFLTQGLPLSIHTFSGIIT